MLGAPKTLYGLTWGPGSSGLGGAPCPLCLKRESGSCVRVELGEGTGLGAGKHRDQILHLYLSCSVTLGKSVNLCTAVSSPVRRSGLPGRPLRG